MRWLPFLFRGNQSGNPAKILRDLMLRGLRSAKVKEYLYNIMLINQQIDKKYTTPAPSFRTPAKKNQRAGINNIYLYFSFSTVIALGGERRAVNKLGKFNYSTQASDRSRFSFSNYNKKAHTSNIVKPRPAQAKYDDFDSLNRKERTEPRLSLRARINSKKDKFKTTTGSTKENVINIKEAFPSITQGRVSKNPKHSATLSKKVPHSSIKSKEAPVLTSTFEAIGDRNLPIKRQSKNKNKAGGPEDLSKGFSFSSAPLVFTPPTKPKGKESNKIVHTSMVREAWQGEGDKKTENSLALGSISTSYLDFQKKGGQKLKKKNYLSDLYSSYFELPSSDKISSIKKSLVSRTFGSVSLSGGTVFNKVGGSSRDKGDVNKKNSENSSSISRPLGKRLKFNLET